MTNEIKERASDKIYAKYLNSLRESLDLDPYWSIDKDRANEFKKCIDK